MNNVVHIPKPDELQEFMDFLFSGLDGYMYVVAKEPDNPESWDQVFFEYPGQVDVAVNAINHYSKSHEIYIAPAIYKNKNGSRDAVKATNVLWCDFDGNTPTEFDIPPSMIVRSSEPGHEHVYWKMDSPLTELPEIEDYNRRLAFKYGADMSGWDATQVLRPPYTINHKRQGAAVATIHRDESLAINLAVFESLAPSPTSSVDYSLWTKLDLPSLNDVIYKNKFGPDFRLIFEKSAEEVADRSSSLTNLSFICAEAGLSDKEIYVILDHVAGRWGKFKHHSPESRARQFMGIIEHTRIKYPTNLNEVDAVFEYSPLSLLQTDIKVEWAIPNMLIKNGSMMVAGEGGIGKSRLSLQFMFHLAAGKPFLHYKIEKPHKLIFFSLEMGPLELKVMMEQMYPYLMEAFSDAERALMNQNLKMLPFGQSLPLNTEAGQNVFLDYLNSNEETDGVFVDSVGSAVLGSINDGANVQNLTNFNDKVRMKYGIFLWYIHHMRKQPPGGKSYGSGDDVYGDIYLTNRATNVYTLVRKGDDIRVRNTKARLAPKEDPYLVHLNVPYSNFTSLGTDAGDPENVVKNLTASQKEKPENDESPNLFS